MNALLKAGSRLAMFAMGYLIWLLLATSAPLNLATWALWLTIDFAVMLSLHRVKKPYELMAVFTVGTAVIVLISAYNLMAGKTPFVWGNAETFTVVAVVIALIIWKFTNDTVGVIVTTLSMVVAGVPTWIDAYRAPELQSVLFWTLSGSACYLTYLGTPKFFVARFMPLSGIFANGLILALSLRQYL